MAESPGILVVDDDRNVLELVAETLRSGGFAVETAVNGTAALQLLARQQFAVILSDQKMPQMTGLEFFKQARQLQPDGIHILLTGVVDLDTVIAAINTGEIYRFVIKPWLRDELLATVRDAVQRHQLIRENRQLHTQTRQANQELSELNRRLSEQVAGEREHRQKLETANRTLEQQLRNVVGMNQILLAKLPDEDLSRAIYTATGMVDIPEQR